MTTLFPNDRPAHVRIKELEEKIKAHTDRLDYLLTKKGAPYGGRLVSKYHQDQIDTFTRYIKEMKA